MDPRLIIYYEAIERASADMLSAARCGNWEAVVKLEGACVLLISQLKYAAEHAGEHVAEHDLDQQAQGAPAQLPLAMQSQEAERAKTRIMRRILGNDAQIRSLAEPWLSELDQSMAGERRTLH